MAALIRYILTPWPSTRGIGIVGEFGDPPSFVRPQFEKHTSGELLINAFVITIEPFRRAPNENLSNDLRLPPLIRFVITIVMSLESIAIAKLMAQKNKHLGPNTLDVAQEYVAPDCL